MPMMYRARTKIEHDEKGWFCVFQLFHGPTAVELVEFEKAIRVGPFPSRQVARAELRGKFRKIVVEAFREFSEQHGARVIAEAFDGHEFTAEQLDAAAGTTREV